VTKATCDVQRGKRKNENGTFIIIFFFFFSFLYNPARKHLHTAELTHGYEKVKKVLAQDGALNGQYCKHKRKLQEKQKLYNLCNAIKRTNEI
jgi:hypothetical protein